LPNCIYILDVDRAKIVADDFEQLQTLIGFIVGVAKPFECLERSKLFLLFLNVRNTKIFVVLDGNVILNTKIPAHDIEDPRLEIFQSHRKISKTTWRLSQVVI